MSKDLFVRRVYTSYGISIVVEIDFVTKTVSLTEKNGSAKRWNFSKRKPEYLNGWRAILKSMEYAVTQAQLELEEQKEKDFEDLAEIMHEIGEQKIKDLASPTEGRS